MVPVTMVLAGLALGIWGRSRARANLWLVVGFVVVLAVQTAVVFGPGHGGSTPAYWLVQAASLTAGLLLLNLIAVLRHRTHPRPDAAS